MDEGAPLLDLSGDGSGSESDRRASLASYGTKGLTSDEDVPVVLMHAVDEDGEEITLVEPARFKPRRCLCGMKSRLRCCMLFLCLTAAVVTTLAFVLKYVVLPRVWDEQLSKVRARFAGRLSPGRHPACAHRRPCCLRPST